MRLSKFTIGFGLYIILSASFATKLWLLLDNAVGDDYKSALRLGIFGILALLIFIYILKAYRGALRIIVVLALFYLGLNFSWRQPYFVEKLHIFEYGFLGWLVTRDLNKKKISIKAILLSALFVLLVAGLDEGFQYFLPYRVCDIRDVITDGISGAFGIALCLLKSRL